MSNSPLTNKDEFIKFVNNPANFLIMIGVKEGHTPTPEQEEILQHYYRGGDVTMYFPRRSL